MKDMKMMAVIAVSAAAMALAACGGTSKSVGSAITSAAADSAEAKAENPDEAKECTGTLDEKKDFMFVVSVDKDHAYAFNVDQAKKLEGYDQLKVGDKVTVTYTGTISVVDPLNGEILSVKKAD